MSLCMDCGVLPGQHACVRVTHLHVGRARPDPVTALGHPSTESDCRSAFAASAYFFTLRAFRATRFACLSGHAMTREARYTREARKL